MASLGHFFKKVLNLPTAENFNIFGHFSPSDGSFAALFQAAFANTKKVENFLKILFVYRTFFTPFLRFYPPSASGERSFALPASLNRASSPPLPRTRLRCATTLEMPYILRALFYIIIFAAAWITSPAFTDNLAELPLIAETRCCIRISSSVPYVVPAICMQGLRGVCGAIGAPF